MRRYTMLLQMLTLRNSRSINDMIFPSSFTAERLAITSSFLPVFTASIVGSYFISDSSIAVRMIVSPVFELRMKLYIDFWKKVKRLYFLQSWSFEHLWNKWKVLLANAVINIKSVAFNGLILVGFNYVAVQTSYLSTDAVSTMKLFLSCTKLLFGSSKRLKIFNSDSSDTLFESGRIELRVSAVE